MSDERTPNENLILQREATLRAIMESSEDHIILVDRDARILYINHTVPDLTPEQVKGRLIYEFTPPAFHQVIIDTFARVLETRQPDRYDTDYVDADGERSYFDARVFPVLEDGEVVSMTVIARNVTERRRQEVERERFFNLSIDLLCVMAPNGRFTRVNPAFEQLLGYSHDELLSAPYVDIIHPDDVESTKRQMQLVLEGEAAIDFENRYRHKDGSYRLIQWRAVPDPTSGVIYGAGRDITGQRELETKLLQSQKMEVIGNLTGGIAHDFNNILLAIMMNVQVGLRRQEPESRTYELLEEIQKGARRAADLTKQLLAFGRQHDLVVVALDVNGVVQGLSALLRRLLPATIELELDINEIAPARADQSQLEQMLINLCLNARDAMPGGGKLLLSTNVEECSGESAAALALTAGRYVVISVTDTGTGIEPDVLEHIFEPFFTTKPLGSGTGLGLSMVYGVAQQLGGAMHVTTTLGEGSTFKIYLPVSSSEIVIEPARDHTAAGGDELILVAEDEDDVRRIVVRVLEDAGYRVIVAKDGRQAIELLETHDDVDLVLLDVVMPYHTGADVFEAMKTRRPGTRVLFMSGYSEGALPGNAQHDSGVPMLRKPFEPDDLLREIRRTLDNDTTT